jgi:hypothetical protein
MSATTIPARGRRYSTRAMLRARQLKAAGWTISQITRLIEQEFGTLPSRSTLDRWLYPARAEQHTTRMVRRRAEARAADSQIRWPGKQPSTARKIARIRMLLELGLSDAQVAKLMNQDFGDDWTRATIRNLRVRESAKPFYARTRRAA